MHIGNSYATRQKAQEYEKSVITDAVKRNHPRTRIWDEELGKLAERLGTTPKHLLDLYYNRMKKPGA